MEVKKMIYLITPYDKSGHWKARQIDEAIAETIAVTLTSKGKKLTGPPYISGSGETGSFSTILPLVL